MIMFFKCLKNRKTIIAFIGNNFADVGQPYAVSFSMYVKKNTLWDSAYRQYSMSLLGLLGLNSSG